MPVSQRGHLFSGGDDAYLKTTRPTALVRVLDIVDCPNSQIPIQLALGAW